MKTCIKCGELILPNVGCECDESKTESVIRCLKTAIELCYIGDKAAAQRWTERADEKLKRMAAMPNEKGQR